MDIYNLANKTHFSTINANIDLYRINDLDVLIVQHNNCKAAVALQGAQLLSWQPTNTTQDVIWLSDKEGFKKGTAIRGGIPLCYPWFSNPLNPSHGYARISLWQVLDTEVTNDNVIIELGLVSYSGELEAKVKFTLGVTCHLLFTNLNKNAVQLAFHAYFNIKDINNTTVENLPTEFNNRITNTIETANGVATISQATDRIYDLSNKQANIIAIDDTANSRQIAIEYTNCDHIVVWNPWVNHGIKDMTDDGYQTMLCVEPANLKKLLNTNDICELFISVQN